MDYASNGGILVNSNILKEIGMTLDDNKTEEELLEAYEKAKSLKVDKASVIPLLVDGKGYQDATLLFLQASFGVMKVSKEGNYRAFAARAEDEGRARLLE